MDGCSRQDPAYRPAKERAPVFRGPLYFAGAPCHHRPVDRVSLIRLQHQPGYPSFLGAATLARLADEMFSVAVVLLVLERTGRAALGGAAGGASHPARR